MAKRFTRTITNIKDILLQNFFTNNVGDILSNNKDMFIHRKKGDKHEYHNLTDNIKTLTAKGSLVKTTVDSDNNTAQIEVLHDETKQDKLIAGNNIIIEDNVITSINDGVSNSNSFNLSSYITHYSFYTPQELVINSFKYNNDNFIVFTVPFKFNEILMTGCYQYLTINYNTNYYFNNNHIETYSPYIFANNIYLLNNIIFNDDVIKEYGSIDNYLKTSSYETTLINTGYELKVYYKIPNKSSERVIINEDYISNINLTLYGNAALNEVVTS